MTSQLGAKWKYDAIESTEVEGQRTLNIGTKHIVSRLHSTTQANEDGPTQITSNVGIKYIESWLGSIT